MKQGKLLIGIGLVGGFMTLTPRVALSLLSPAQPYSPAQYPERYTVLQELQGTVRQVDMTGGLIYVEDRQGRRWGLTVDDYTTISKSSSKPLRLKDLKAGDPVYLYYTTWNQRALHIDRLLTYTRAVLGAP